MPPDRRRREFFRLWVRRESELKRIGTGIGVPAAVDRGWIVDLAGQEGAAAALAASHAPSELRCWTFRPAENPRDEGLGPVR
jgi:hypothetical protein